MASLGMAILMVSFTTVLAGYSVSPVRFTKSNFREVQMQTASNFRRALAISLAEASQQLEFKSRIRQYSTYLDLESYPAAEKLGYNILSKWQNLTMLIYPGIGLNLTASVPMFNCSWNSTVGISYVKANMTLDILSYGFYGFRESSTASLNLTLLDLNQSGSVMSFFFSLKAENDRPVPDLSDSSIRVLYLKTNGGWNSSDPVSNRVYYLGQGVYLVSFVASDMDSPPHIRLIVQDSRGIVVGARTILSSSNETDKGPITSNVVAVPNPSNGVGSVTISASVSDLFTGRSIIQSAQCIVNDSIGEMAFNGTMNAADGAFNEITEEVTIALDVSDWETAEYTVYVRGQDSNGNWGNFSSTILKITLSSEMHVESIVMSLHRHGQGSVYAVAVVTILDENGSPVSDAKVTVRWSGATTEGPVYQYTNPMGKATFYSKSVNKNRIWTFTITVDNVERTGYVYDNPDPKPTASITYRP